MVYLAADQGVIKECGTNADRACAGNQKFNGVFGTGDTTLADNGNSVIAAHLIDLVDLQQGDRFDGRTGQSA